MDFSSQRARNLLTGLLVLCAVNLILLGFFFVWGRPEWICREAYVYETLCRELLKNSTEGRQALVSSVWWPPFCCLVRLPLAAILPAGEIPYASLLTNLIFAVLAVWRLFRFLGDFGLGRLRFVLLVALSCNPLFLKEALSGSSAMVILFFVVLLVQSLFRWRITRALKHLVYFGVAGAALVALSVEAFFWMAPIFLWFAWETFRGPFVPMQRQAILIMAVLPVLYVLGLWVLMNWLVMGDALYFLRSLFMDVQDRFATSLPAFAQRSLPLFSFAMGLAALVGVMRRDRHLAMPLALVCMGPAVFQFFFQRMGWLWPESMWFVLHLPLCVMAAAIAASAVGARGHRVGRLLFVGLPVLFSITLAVMALTLKEVRVEEGLPVSTVEERSSSLFGVERYVMAKSRYAKVFVCGYDSLAFCETGEKRVFTPALDLDFGRARNDYRGHCLFVLVHKPEGRSGMDSVHWKHMMVFTLGGQGTLYDGDWGAWRLFEVIQAPMTP